ncbi:translation initiation factor IF-2-like [Phyllostomus hastatus]|uniref:translation initiation factor IF-2-like n=1 Tax=Phyllostomus hastatus TaxID=9423 RepID=UPI001E6825BD|nr:translation initiation factor IF-2-like [Phyllostomus hastatus]
MRWARGFTDLRAGGAPSRQPLAPSSAATEDEAAATNLPSGTATDTITGVREPTAAPNSGREGGVRAEKGRGQAPRLWVRGRRTEGRGRSEPRGRGDERTLRQRRKLGRAADAAAAGFVVFDSVPSPAEHAGNQRAGRRGGPGAARRRRAGPEVAGLPGTGTTPLPVAILRPAPTSSSPNPWRRCWDGLFRCYPRSRHLVPQGCGGGAGQAEGGDTRLLTRGAFRTRGQDVLRG